MTEETIVIRDITESSEMRAVEELQREVWGLSERDIVSVFMLAATGAVGGVLIGAYDAGALVGFAYGFVGLERGRFVMHSDMLAVKFEYRARGLGFRLKLAQRERALARGLQVMTWTFDPLQSANAHLNFAKLGVVSDTYRINFYGEQSSSFLHAAGTDRLWLTWPLTSRRVRERIERGADDDATILEGLPTLVNVGADDAPTFDDTVRLSQQGRVLIEIPTRIGELQKRQPELAHAWRLATRRAFTEALAAGFIVEDFYRRERDGRRVGVYLLTSGKKLEEFMTTDE